jgi:FKBP-type peptidyl-prolyl cis-trans isomerase 2
MAVFKNQNIRPFVGLTLDVDGSRGVVRSISGGRVIVDFNHPLAGKKIEYELDIKRKVTDQKEQLKSFIDMLRLPYDSINIEGSKAKVIIKIDLPKEIKETLEKDLNRITSLDVELMGENEKAESKLENKIRKDKEEDKTEN